MNKKWNIGKDFKIGKFYFLLVYLISKRLLNGFNYTFSLIEYDITDNRIKTKVEMA